jgi:transcription termination factor Rho
MVEMGQDVVILLDSVTRLSRAYNVASPDSGKVLTGGLDFTSLYPPKRFLGAARNLSEHGSLTILATALVNTGSKMDDVIFEEFKGTGNMELRLDREMASHKIYPAINLAESGTRKEELLYKPQELESLWKMRKAILSMKNDAEAITLLKSKLVDCSSIFDFFEQMKNSGF